MTTGIYTTKWFLQCFIDRVRMLCGCFAALPLVRTVNLPGPLNKHHSLEVVATFYAVGYYAHSCKAKKLIRARNSRVSPRRRQFLITSGCWEEAQQPRWASKPGERLLLPTGTTAKPLPSLGLWKQRGETRAGGPNLSKLPRSSCGQRGTGDA